MKLNASIGAAVEFVEANHPAVEAFHSTNTFALIEAAQRQLGQPLIDWFKGSLCMCYMAMIMKSLWTVTLPEGDSDDTAHVDASLVTNASSVLASVQSVQQTVQTVPASNVPIALSLPVQLPLPLPQSPSHDHPSTSTDSDDEMKRKHDDEDDDSSENSRIKKMKLSKDIKKL